MENINELETSEQQYHEAYVDGTLTRPDYFSAIAQIHAKKSRLLEAGVCACLACRACRGDLPESQQPPIA